MKIRLITSHSAKSIDANVAQATQIGKKGLGLLEIPSPWSIPFVAIDSSVFNDYINIQDVSEKKELLQNVAKYLSMELKESGIFDDDTIIIRSSGVKEGITERGLYESKTCKTSEIVQTLTELFDGIIQEHRCLPDVAYIVQKSFEGEVIGHLSNERRFTPVKRDWIYEYRCKNVTEIESGRISLRKWRKPFSATGKEVLRCSKLQDLRDVLRIIAEYYTQEKQIVHFEFIWDGNRIYLVQADRGDENAELGEDPTAIDISIHEAKDLSNLQILRNVSDADRRFSKVANTLVYAKAGLKTVPLYILDDKNILSEIQGGFLPPRLADDLKKLSNFSVVIRTDIVTNAHDKKQLLNRSNELRSFDKLVEWLFAQKELLGLKEDIAFLFHVFVPARCSAFVKASPTGRIVEIEALWGLPEGLYYNAHDKVFVDTKLIEAELLTPDVAEIKKIKRAYKETFIAPNNSGAWIGKRTKQPYDWKLCIDEASIKQIAIESRKIANLEQKQISVMWFIGIDQVYYGTANLAWYHEAYTEKSYTELDYKRKHFYENVLVVSDIVSYQKFVNDPSVKQVRIHPVEDSLLRDRKFLEKVGKAAVAKGATIILEGTALAHPLYQLCRTGAKVIIPNEQDEFGEEENYNKLVRDKIPEMIEQNGEDICCYVLGKNAFLRALLEKTVEEAYEIINATNEEALKEELCDEYEVLSSIERMLCNGAVIDRIHFKTLKVSSEFVFQSELEETMDIPFGEETYCQIYSLLTMGNIMWSVSCDATQLQIELHFSRSALHSPSIERSIPTILKDSLAKEIAATSFSLTSTTEITEVLEQVKELRSLVFQAGQSVPNWGLEALQQKAKGKRDKRGGFEMGYMLKSTKLGTTQCDDQEQQMLELPPKRFKETVQLEYQPVKNIDYLDRERGELLVRFSLPICFNEYQVLLDSTSVQKYIGTGKKLMLSFIRKGNNLEIRVDLSTDLHKSEQLSLYQ